MGEQEMNPQHAGPKDANVDKPPSDTGLVGLRLAHTKQNSNHYLTPTKQ